MPYIRTLQPAAEQRVAAETLRALRVRLNTTVRHLMIPFCWIVFYDQGVDPREGHVLWIVGMVLALFSEWALMFLLLGVAS